ncbi:hypothetical protein HZA75_02170 [Candidatus Roizmanbacteria bacterium]|nr:hypothetical protein [Candidatus Roizmanbacteria bacterium]
MKITIYTIKDCAFSKQEKEYLNTNKLQYVEKDLETNKDFLTEMLAVSNNFAGTPVTRVEKDDGSIAVLKGFTKEEFDTTFGFTTAPTVTTAPSTEPGHANDTPIPPVVETPVATTPDLSTDLSSKVSTTEEASAKVDPLKSVMNDLQSKSQPIEVQPTMPPVEQPTTPTPSIPDFPADGKTTV